MKKSPRPAARRSSRSTLSKENQQVIRYWRDAIAESDRSEVKDRRYGAVDLPKESVLRGQCPPSIFRATLQAIEDDRRGDRSYRDLDPGQPLPVLIAPIQLRNQSGSMSGIGVFEPLWMPAFLDPSGVLIPPIQGEPWIPRTLLEPIMEDNYPAIGKLDDMTAFVEKAGSGRWSGWSEYWGFADALFRHVTGSAVYDFSLKGYTTRPTGLLARDTTGSGALIPIRESYDRVLDGEQHPGLLPEFARTAPRKKSILVESRSFVAAAANKHCAQFGNKFPLAPSQRRAVHQALSLSDGEFLCVTGPPGTGKTTLLQSIIASLWIQAIRNERSVPPIIVATGATNQAVTNVITALERGSGDDALLAQRWIPYVSSYGTFCASNTKADAAEGGFQVEKRNGEGFSNEREQWEFVSHSTRYFLSCYKNAFAEDLPLEAAVRALAKRVLYYRGELYREVIRRKDGSVGEWLKSLVGLHPKRPVEELFAGLADFDQQLRYEIFLYGARFWEGRWLLEMQEELTRRNQIGDNKTTRRHRTADWQRRAMLTPTFVSTLSMLPRFFPHDRRAANPRPPIDFLIFDEASQITPELGAGALGYAARAVIVGDAQQLEPVWNVLPHVDRANCVRHGLLSRDTDVGWRGLNDQGLLASSGSLMKLAIRCSKHDDGQSTIGVFLSEQRRSVPEIMAVSNALAYRGRLQPFRPPVEDRLFPALGYVQVSGRSEKQGTSRLNRPEAEQIVAWIINNRDRLLRHYGTTTLEDIVAVISPFAAQVDFIRKRLAPLEADKILVGTVNSLQGAERSIVLFSTVYDTRFQDTYFFDRGPNMLNVAVSRAKDSFIVFGEMAIFDRREGTPSWLLGRFLFANPENEIEPPQLPPPEVPVERTHVTNVLSEVRKLLQETIAGARRKVIIISPQITVSAVKADRLVPLIQDARARGVDVQIYTDWKMDFSEATGEMRIQTALGRKLLVDAGATLTVVKGIHQKTLSCDDTMYTTGSFNWLSAVRDPSNPHCRVEETAFHYGPHVSRWVANSLAEFNYRGTDDQTAVVEETIARNPRPVRPDDGQAPPR